MVNAMRQELEKEKISHEDEMTMIRRTDNDEKQQLREAIVVLRSRLEENEKG